MIGGSTSSMPSDQVMWASGGVLAPILTHVTWSLGMLLVLPPIMGAVL